MEVTKINVTLEGIADLMFNRFVDHSKEVRPPDQKLYLAEGNKLVIPAENIVAGFLFGENPPGCAKTFEGRKSKNYIRIGYGHVFVEPGLIPIRNEKKELVFDGFDNGMFWMFSVGGRTKASSGPLSIKQPAEPRPVLKMPWFIDFQIKVLGNPLVNETKLFNWFTQGGLEIALCAYRPRFGRFIVNSWEIEK